MSEVTRERQGEISTLDQEPVRVVKCAECGGDAELNDMVLHAARRVNRILRAKKQEPFTFDEIALCEVCEPAERKKRHAKAIAESGRQTDLWREFRDRWVAEPEESERDALERAFLKAVGDSREFSELLKRWKPAGAKRAKHGNGSGAGRT